MKKDKWTYNVENGYVIIYKNNEYYDEASIDTLTENYIDKIIQNGKRKTMLNNLPEKVGSFALVEKSYWNKEDTPAMPIIACYRTYDKHGCPVELIIKKLKYEMLNDYLKTVLRNAKTYTLHLQTSTFDKNNIFGSNNLEEVINYMKIFAQNRKLQPLKK